VYSGKNTTDQSKIFILFMLLENTGRMEVVTVDGFGGSCVASVKGTAHSYMENQKIMPMWMKMI
jgi:hypothetical protein